MGGGVRSQMQPSTHQRSLTDDSSTAAPAIPCGLEGPRQVRELLCELLPLGSPLLGVDTRVYHDCTHMLQYKLNMLWQRRAKLCKCM